MNKEIFSITIALIIGYAIGSRIFNREITHGPDSNNIKKSIYQHKEGCYVMSPVAHICPFHISGN